MAHRDLFEIILKNTDKFPLNFVNYPGRENIRRLQEGRRYLIEKDDIPLIESYRQHVGTVHQCQMPWVVGFGLNGGRPHVIPDGRTIWQFINDEVGELKKDKAREWLEKALNKILSLIPEYIRSSYTMKVIAEQGDLLNLCGGVMVSRTGYNPVHAFLLMLAGLGFTGNTYNSPGVDTGDFSERVKKIYLPSGVNPDEYTLLLRNTGGEATFLGMKTAKEFTGRTHRIGYAGSYHGRFEFVDVNYFEHVIKFPDILTGISEDDSIQQLKEVLRKDGHNISSLIMEAVQGGACYLPGKLSNGVHFYDAVRELCDEFGVVFVMDLVQVNGITGSWNPVEEVGAKKGPHIYALGKGFSEAYPLSGVLMPKEYVKKLEIGGWTSTYSMHWQGPTAGMGIFLINDYMKKEMGKDLMEYSRPLGEYFNQKLDQLASEYNGKRISIQHQGMKRGFMHSFRFSSLEPADRFVESLTELGCFVFDTIKRSSYSTVKLFPPLLSTKEGLDEALFCIDYSLQRI